MKKGILMFMVVLFLWPNLMAQEQTGSLRGLVTDEEGNPLPGVSITVSSPAMMGTQTFITTSAGTYRFPALPPGIYKLVAEIPGYKTVTRENIIVRVGMILSINITMEVTKIEEQVIVTAPSPTVDVKQSKIAITIDSNMIRNLPIARTLRDIVATAPGAIMEGDNPMLHGSTVRANTYQIDGVGINNPAVLSTITALNFEAIEEVEMVAGGHPASVGFTDGLYINVVTRSGGNRFSGNMTIYLATKHMAKSIWTDEQYAAFGLAGPSLDKYNVDSNLNLGGPILKDKLWFFASFNYIKTYREIGFIPFTDIFGRYHPDYDIWSQYLTPFLKLTTQLSPKLRIFTTFQYRDYYSPISGGGTWSSKFNQSVRDHDDYYVASMVLNYVYSQNTMWDLRLGYVMQDIGYLFLKEVKNEPRIYDSGSPYGYLTNPRYEETYLRWRQQFGLHYTHFRDDFLGGNHEIKAGFEYENAYGDWDTWRKDNMMVYFNSRLPGNYYYGTTTWKGIPNVGYGLVYFYIMGTEEGSCVYVGRIRRISGYLQDSFTIGRKLTLNLGLRFDRMWSWHPPQKKAQSGNPLSIYLGETLIRPYSQQKWPNTFPNGINPWGELVYDGWERIHSWNTLSPRIGFSFDLFGNGRTAIKGSYSRYSEYLMTQYLSSGVHPFAPQSYGFYWYDINFNGWPDISDEYAVYGAPDFRRLDSQFNKLKVDPNSKSPLNDEIIIGITQEIYRNVSASINFIYKDKKNILEDVLWDPDNNEYWYHIDQAGAKKYWIPFTAIVPGTDNYPDRTVTFYVRSNNSPSLFYRITNVPELKRKYKGLELLINKRMSEGWQLSGSVTIGKAYGNIGGQWDDSYGASGAGDDPNYFINRWGRTNADSPLIIKLMGTFQLPYGIVFSAYYRFEAGGHWGRSASIRPPSSWCNAKNGYRTYYSVYIEPYDLRKSRDSNYLDLRAEKEIKIGGIGKLSFYVDAYNVLGYGYLSIGVNDIYRYDPSGENVREPQNVMLSTTYKMVTGLSGMRTFRLGIRFNF